MSDRHLWRNAQNRGRHLWAAWSVSAVVLVLIAVLLFGAGVRAQEVDTWSAPENLSNAGTATEPQLLVDGRSRAHVLWNDEFAGPIYTWSDGLQWASPARVGALPFGSRVPLLVSAGDRVHAFWLAEEPEAAAAGVLLLHSSVEGRQFASPGSWTGVQIVTDSVIGFHAAADATGRLHLASLRTSGSLAGLYYSQLATGSDIWSSPRVVYESAYLRLLEPADASISVAALGAEDLFIAWADNETSELLTLHTRDAGRIWSDPTPAKTGAARATSGSIAGVQLIGQGNNMHLIWHSKAGSDLCNYYHQWTSDLGDSWEPAQPLFSAALACEQTAHFVDSSQSLLLITTGTQPFLAIWQDGVWSAPQAQPLLAGFRDPAGRQIAFGCGQAVGRRNDQLLVVACGVGVGQDIWAFYRSVNALVATLETDAIWQLPDTVTATEGALSNPLLVSDSRNRWHLFWTEGPLPPSGAPEAAGTLTLYHAASDGDGWTEPVALFEGETAVSQPRVTATGDGRLLAVWLGGSDGQVYFAWADAGRASVASEWSEPVRIPMPRPSGSAPDVAQDVAGTVHVAYALPINEGRGIYHTRSEDGGTTWSAPVQLFDGAGAGWEEIGAPQLVVTGATHLHVAWNREHTPPGTAGLLYARSDDGGGEWSPPVELNSADRASGEIVWYELSGFGAGSLHLAWQTWDGAQLQMRHQFSLDDGFSWSRPLPVGNARDELGPASLTVDPAGRAHLLQLVTNPPPIHLKHWTWVSTSWQSDATFALPGSIESAALLSSAMTQSGDLGAAFLSRSGSVGSDALLMTARQVELPAELPTPLPTLTPTTTPPPAPTGTPLPEPSATPSFPTTNDANPVPGLSLLSYRDTRVVGAAVAFLPAAFLVLVVMALALRKR